MLKHCLNGQSRAKDLAKLENWIVCDRRRLISLLGMGGIVLRPSAGFMSLKCRLILYFLAKVER
jgi:hypothetical protein